MNFVVICCCMWMALGINASVSIASKEWEKSRVERIQGVVVHLGEMGKLVGYISIWSVLTAVDAVRAKMTT